MLATEEPAAQTTEHAPATVAAPVANSVGRLRVSQLPDGRVRVAEAAAIRAHVRARRANHERGRHAVVGDGAAHEALRVALEVERDQRHRDDHGRHLSARLAREHLLPVENP